MEILKTPAEMRAWRRAHPASLGLTPTMGYLHEGHLELVRRSLAENELSAASIFVNPAQFGPNEDFERYPRDEERDLQLLRELGVDAVYMPSVEVMYPEGYQTYVTVEELAQGLEGGSRPVHFRGVATVVTKLLNVVGPDRAYFGKKDAQQLRVIRRLARDLDLPGEIVACETVREEGGLAMSSRNAYLTREQRAAARVLSRALSEAEARFAEGVRSAEVLRVIVSATVGDEPLADLDYVSVADSETLAEIEGDIEGVALLSLAAKFGAVRLIDNVTLGKGG
jgi:pantoate--beta-alanine ligase